MSKWFYFSKQTRFRLILLFLVLSFFGPWWLSIYLILFYALGLWLFRRKQIDFTSRRTIESNIILCPISGRLQKIDSDDSSIRLTISTSMIDDYGIIMPFYGEVRSFFSPDEVRDGFEIIVESKDIEFVKLSIQKSIIAPQIFTDAGDKASTGALLGFKPLGGKCVVELPVGAELAVKPGDKLMSSQTILASI